MTSERERKVEDRTKIKDKGDLSRQQPRQQPDMHQPGKGSKKQPNDLGRPHPEVDREEEEEDFPA